MRKAIIILPLLLLGCTKSREYYETHADERTSKVEECAAAGVQYANDEDCANSQEADYAVRQKAKRD